MNLWVRELFNPIMATSFKRSYVSLLHSVPPTLQQATANPRLHQRLLDTHRQVWVSLLWRHFSFLLRPGVYKVLFVPSKSLFPQSCVSSSSSMVGLMATPSKRAYAIPNLYPEPLTLWQSTADPYLHRRHSDTVFSQSLWGFWVLVCTRFVWALWVSLVCMGFDSKGDFTPPTILLELLCPWMWGVSSQSLQHCAATAPVPLLTSS